MRRYIRSNYHIRAMISRVKYYRRRKAEFLRMKRKKKNLNFFFYAFRYLMRKKYFRIFKFHKQLTFILSKIFTFSVNKNIVQNKISLTSRKRRHERDDFEDDSIAPEKHHSAGLYYTDSKMTKRQQNVLTTINSVDGGLWNLYRTFLNSTFKVKKNKVFSQGKKMRLSNLTRITGQTVRALLGLLQPLEVSRQKFSIVNYALATKVIKVYFKANYYFRKMSGVLWKKSYWQKLFFKKSLWKSTRMLNIKLLNKVKIIIHKTYNNFYITAIKREKKIDKVIVGYSAGCSGLIGSKRMSPISAEKVAKKFINKFFDKVDKFVNVDIYLKCKKIDASIRNILNILIKTKKIHYSKYFNRRILIRLVINKLLIINNITHNGIRKRHQRRV